MDDPRSWFDDVIRIPTESQHEPKVTACKERSYNESECYYRLLEAMVIQARQDYMKAGRYIRRGKTEFSNRNAYDNKTPEAGQIIAKNFIMNVFGPVHGADAIRSMEESLDAGTGRRVIRNLKRGR